MNYIIPLTLESANYADRLYQFLKDWEDTFGIFLDRPDTGDTQAINAWILQVAMKAKPEIKDKVDKLLELSTQTDDVADQMLLLNMYTEVLNIGFEQLKNHSIQDSKIVEKMVIFVDEFCALTNQEKPKSAKQYKECLKNIMLEPENDFFHPLLTRFIQSFVS